MKKLISNLLIILLIGLAIAVSYFYTPASVKELHEKVNQSSPLSSLSGDRWDLVREYGSYLADGLPEDNPKLYFYWFSNQRKLSDLRVRKALEEIRTTNVEKGDIRIWSLLNMGVVIKTGTHSIAIDTANLPFSQAHNELTDLVNIFIVSHKDGDHFDATLLKTALEKGKKVVLLEGFIFDGAESENIIKIASGRTKNVDGVKVTAYQTDHRGDGNFMDPNAWFVVEIGGFKLLHTGDGRDFKNKDEMEKVYAIKDFDILLGNTLLHPYNVRDLEPKVFVPMHLFKFMSGNDLYQESTIEAIFDVHRKYERDLQGIKMVYLLPGEGFTYPLEIKKK